MNASHLNPGSTTSTSRSTAPAARAAARTASRGLQCEQRLVAVHDVERPHAAAEMVREVACLELHG